jgi:NAD(P)-dependent dehydrogenase (short-subunit alcohol dehydrogenase family)
LEKRNHFAGKAAIITGGSRGIGLAIATELVAHGAGVVLTSRDSDAADRAADSLGGGAVGVGAHAVDEEAAVACVDLAMERFGRVDVLVNNAGTNPAYGDLVDQDHLPFAKTLDVNLWAPILWSRLVWERSMRDHGGAIVNVSSAGGFTVAPGLGVYNASKAALISMTRQLAVELAPRVRVNAVAPGVVRTRLSEALWSSEAGQRTLEATPLGRFGEPADVATAVAFLAGDGAAWITGEHILIDGGQALAAGLGPERNNADLTATTTVPPATQTGGIDA